MVNVSAHSCRIIIHDVIMACQALQLDMGKDAIMKRPGAAVQELAVGDAADDKPDVPDDATLTEENLQKLTQMTLQDTLSST